MTVVLTEDAAGKLFPGKDAVNQKAYNGNNAELVTIGGISRGIRGSEFEQMGPRAYIRLSETDVKGIDAGMLPWLEVSVRVKPETAADFADAFMTEKSSLVEIGNLYLQNITPLSTIREDALREGKGEMKTRLSILFFLLMNIFLGIVGTFWYRTRQRQGEMGLRMALGSTRRQLRGIVLWEGIALLTLAFIPAALICLNIMYVRLVDTALMESGLLRFLAGMLLTYLLIALMIVAGIWYPANEATRLQPAEALHCE